MFELSWLSFSEHLLYQLFLFTPASISISQFCLFPTGSPLAMSSPSPSTTWLSDVSNLDYFTFLFVFKCIVVQLPLSAFSPHPSTPPQPNPPASPASTLPLGFVHVSFIVVSENPSPHYPLPTPLWLLLDCSNRPCFLSSLMPFNLLYEVLSNNALKYTSGHVMICTDY